MTRHATPEKTDKVPRGAGLIITEPGRFPALDSIDFPALHHNTESGWHLPQGSMLTNTGAASGWKSTDIITLKHVMVTMENMNSLRAQRESSTAAL